MSSARLVVWNKRSKADVALLATRSLAGESRNDKLRSELFVVQRPKEGRRYRGTVRAVRVPEFALLWSLGSGLGGGGAVGPVDAISPMLAITARQTRIRGRQH